MKFHAAVTGLPVLLLAACVANPAQDRAGPQPPLLPPSSLGAAHTSQQILRLAFGGHEATLRCVVQAGPERIQLMALTAMGLRALTVAWDGRDWQIETAPQLPAAMPPQALIADLELALWPLSTLQEAYAPAGWEVSEPGGGVRRLRYQGRLVAEVAYADTDPWKGRYWISNFRYGYAIAIQPDTQTQ